MTVLEYLGWATAHLTSAGVETPRLDAVVLLEDCVRLNRALLLAHPERQLSPDETIALNLWVARRYKHEPLAYIRGHSEFYGRIFLVDKNVLIPRPESEAMIELLLKLSVDANIVIIDIGTGSGALAISAKLERPAARVIATDVSAACLEVARRNADRLAASLEYMQGNLLQPLAHQQLKDYILLCNLPYVPDQFNINRAARHEPGLALFAGTDGLDLYRDLFAQLDKRKTKPVYLLAESLAEQHDTLAVLAAEHGYMLHSSDGLIQVFSPRIA